MKFSLSFIYCLLSYSGSLFKVQDLLGPDLKIDFESQVWLQIFKPNLLFYDITFLSSSIS